MALERFPDVGAPDWGFAADDPEVEVEESNFGDGYTLRRPKGINYIRDGWSPSYSDLRQAQAEAAYQWLRARKNLTAFLWTHPITGEDLQVVCTGVSLAYVAYDDYQLRVQLKRDFNPL